MKVKRAIDREELPPLVIRNTIPVCMGQYERVFGTTRYVLYVIETVQEGTTVVIRIY